MYFDNYIFKNSRENGSKMNCQKNLLDYDLFIFDFDGTIMDTELLHYRAWMNVINNRMIGNFEQVLLNDFFKHNHSLNEEDKKRFLYYKYNISEEEYYVLYEKKHAEYYKIIEENKLTFVRCFENILDFILKNDKKFVIVTNTSLKNIQYFLDKFSVLNKADKIYTKELYSQKKPHPECYIKVLNDYPTERKIGFEDSLIGFHSLYQVSEITPVLIVNKNYYYCKYIIDNYRNIILSDNYNLDKINEQLHNSFLEYNGEHCENQIDKILNNNINELQNNFNNMKNIINQVSILLKNKNPQNNIFLTGMGKSGYVCKKSASTWQSLSIPCSYIDLPNLPHGDFGMLKDGDIMIVISNNGNTDEILYILKYIKYSLPKKITIIGIIANTGSEMEAYCDYSFILNNIKESDNINMAPSTSSMIFMCLLDSIGIYMRNDITKEEFKNNHPAGSLGKR